MLINICIPCGHDCATAATWLVPPAFQQHYTSMYKDSLDPLFLELGSVRLQGIALPYVMSPICVLGQNKSQTKKTKVIRKSKSQSFIPLVKSQNKIYKNINSNPQWQITIYNMDI